MTPIQRMYQPIKRFIDILLSLFAIFLLLPVLLIISILIKLDSKGPILFKQKRVGLYGEHFNIYKFRTMTVEAPSDAPTDRLTNPSLWITTIGKFLRKTSIDELPQLINILKGEMSIVGPRPALWNQHVLIKLREESMIHTIKPGLTGWAQVNGRDENNDNEKLYWDKQYYDNYSFTFDIKCIFKTIITVIMGKGVVEGGVVNGKESANNGKK